MRRLIQPWPRGCSHRLIQAGISHEAALKMVNSGAAHQIGRGIAGHSGCQLG
jgi:hypothetical protein